MRSLFTAALAGLILAGSALAGFAETTKPQIYRWKDRAGKEHITNVPPPPGATSLDVPPAQGQPSSEPPSAQAQDASQNARRPAPPGLTAEQVLFWQGLDQRFEEARNKQDTASIEAMVEGLVRESLWGGGLWAIPLLPIATLALVVLLGWWAGSGLRQPWAAGMIVLAVVVGLALVQLTLSRFLYRIQLTRLQSNFTLLESHLGGKVPRPSNRKLIQEHMATLGKAARPSASPWAFLTECRTAEDAMIKVALDP